MAKTLLIDVQAIHAHSAGALTYVRGMLDGLSHVEHDYRIVLVCHQDILDLFPRHVYSGVLAIPVRSRALFQRMLYSVWLHRRIEKEYSDGDAIYWAPLNMGVVSRFSRIKTVVTIHDFLAFQYPECVGWRRRPFRRRGVVRAIKCADAIVCISDFTKQQLYLLFKDGITNKKVCRIYLGGKDISLDRERAHPILQEGESFLLFVGVGGKNKNLPFLVACFDRLRREYAYLGKLYIVGQSGQDKDLIRAIGDLRLEQHVRQLGFVDDAELPSLYRACDAFVFPSYYEGFGLPALEASRYGARVCASDAASLGEIAPLCNAHCANPFDEYEFTQAMHETVNSARPPELEAECFNWENAAHQLLEICNALFVSKHVRSRGGTS